MYLSYISRINKIKSVFLEKKNVLLISLISVQFSVNYIYKNLLMCSYFQKIKNYCVICRYLIDYMELKIKITHGFQGLLLLLSCISICMYS